MAQQADKYLSLEDVLSKTSLAWVRKQNKKTHKAAEGFPFFKEVQQETLDLLDAKDKVEFGLKRADGYIYQLEQTSDNPKGIWSRSDEASYLAGKPDWQEIFNLDDYAEQSGVDWVWKGATLSPEPFNRVLLQLSDGGSDAMHIFEFDLNRKAFVSNGFYIPEAKTRVSWRGMNSLFVSTDVGKDSLTDSGYPRIVKIWRRGQSLSEARTVYKGSKTSLAAGGYHDDGHDYVYESLSFWETKTWRIHSSGELRALNMPTTADFEGIAHGYTYWLLHEDLEDRGQLYPQGSLVAVSNRSICSNFRRIRPVFTPKGNQTLEGVAVTKGAVLLTVLEDVKGMVYRIKVKDGTFGSAKKMKMPENGELSIVWADEASDAFWFSYESCTDPVGQYAYKNGKYSVIAQAPSRFADQDMRVQQLFAKSVDGTMVPYFVLHHKNVKLNGKNPTLVYGYGGFRISMTPRYLGMTGKSWLERGGVYVMANIRGGAEYGPAWHESVLRENRPKCYEDMAAVVSSVHDHGYASPETTAVYGGSNGGLMAGAMLVHYPGLFGAVIIAVPLLDMLRYHKLLAGASWVGEYGNPDVPEDRAFLEGYSPYQNVQKDEDYPAVFIYTSTKDDRVHPGHARKMAAKLQEYGHDTLYYENESGGHAGASDMHAQSYLHALKMSFLFEKLT